MSLNFTASETSHLHQVGVCLNSQRSKNEEGQNPTGFHLNCAKASESSNNKVSLPIKIKAKNHKGFGLKEGESLNTRYYEIKK